MVKFAGEPLTLEGQIPNVGDQAPAFKLENTKGETKTLADYAGQKVILSVFPDVNTKVCSNQAKKFSDLQNETEASILSFSTNTAAEISNWEAEQDAKLVAFPQAQEFGKAYGLYVPDKDILVRAVFVIDEEGKIIYKDVMDDVVEEPDYTEAINAAQ